MKGFVKLLLLLACLGAAWFGLRQVDWVNILQTESRQKEMEEELGDLYWKFFKEQHGEVTDSVVIGKLDKIITRICEANNIDRSLIKLHVLDMGECNAFALPDHHMVVCRGLFECAEGPDEIAGVLGHEIAHMEKRHIMKKLIREVGLTALASIVSGAGGEILRESAHTLTSAAYDRKLEREADVTSVEYLLAANIDPTPFSDFMQRLGEAVDIPEEFYWIASHDESGERADMILDHIGKQADDGEYSPSLTETEWRSVKSALNQ